MASPIIHPATFPGLFPPALPMLPPNAYHMGPYDQEYDQERANSSPEGDRPRRDSRKGDRRKLSGRGKGKGKGDHQSQRPHAYNRARKPRTDVDGSVYVVGKYDSPVPSEVSALVLCRGCRSHVRLAMSERGGRDTVVEGRPQHRTAKDAKPHNISRFRTDCAQLQPPLRIVLGSV